MSVLFTSSLLFIWHILASPVTSSSPQIPTDPPHDVTIDNSDYFTHEEDPYVLWSVTLSTVTASSLPNGTNLSSDYEDDDYYYYYGQDPPRPPHRHLDHLTLGVIVGTVALILVLALSLLLWRFGTCRRMEAQIESGGAEGGQDGRITGSLE